MKSNFHIVRCGGYLLIMFCLFTGSYPLLAQWIQTNGPTDVWSFAVSGKNIFAGTYDKGIFLSTDNGTNWTAVNNGLTIGFIYALTVSSDGAGDTSLFAGSIGNGIFRSTNNGTSWTAVNTGLTRFGVYSFMVSNSNLFAGTYGGVFLSTNNGTNWIAVNTGLPTNTTVYSLAVSDSNLFAGTVEDGVFLSTNNGTNWTPVNNGLTSMGAYSLAVSGANLFAGTFGGDVFLSANNGMNWTSVYPGIPNTLTYTVALAVSGTNLFAGTRDGIFRSTNNGTNWIEVDIGLTDTHVSSFAVNDTYLFAEASGGVWKRPLSEINTSVDRFSNALPMHFNLDQNYPNPFNPATTISFSLSSRSFILLKVFDLIGREVATIVSEELSAGNHSRQWNAADLPSGIYFYRLQAGTFTETRKLVLLR